MELFTPNAQQFHTHQQLLVLLLLFHIVVWLTIFCYLQKFTGSEQQILAHQQFLLLLNIWLI
jgi:hypothetical protein